ncbi:transcriptional regulator [Advenella kashmirensis W13003]|uniref:Transcriptional regulator n=1 Tax=Advenella kashmirensis W13003 TaxID=1424334 RepID=V8QLK9_9BURK|nr:FMN-binding negative transcriptional regulator [Advenella kashmirensis]ETF00512.1 transcriptional regulator [Advenella kashmirensis W13003]
MYNPSFFRIADPRLIADLIRSYPLGLLISLGPDGVQASPLPFLFFPDEGEHGVLRAHLARANPHWSLFAQDPSCLLVFQGEQGYISPSWYPGKATTHRVVPTWNYAMVQIRGTVRTTDDPAWLHSQISALTRQQESGMPSPWQVSDAPPEFIEQQKRAIVGLEITITHIEGKWKMSQNRNAADQAGVIDGLRNTQATEGSQALADTMSRILKKTDLAQ